MKWTNQAAVTHTPIKEETNSQSNPVAKIDRWVPAPIQVANQVETTSTCNNCTLEIGQHQIKNNKTGQITIELQGPGKTGLEIESNPGLFPLIDHSTSHSKSSSEKVGNQDELKETAPARNLINNEFSVITSNEDNERNLAKEQVISSTEGDQELFTPIVESTSTSPVNEFIDDFPTLLNTGLMVKTDSIDLLETVTEDSLTTDDLFLSDLSTSIESVTTESPIEIPENEQVTAKILDTNMESAINSNDEGNQQTPSIETGIESTTMSSDFTLTVSEVIEREFESLKAMSVTGDVTESFIAAQGVANNFSLMANLDESFLDFTTIAPLLSDLVSKSENEESVEGEAGLEAKLSNSAESSSKVPTDFEQSIPNSSIADDEAEQAFQTNSNPPTVQKRNYRGYKVYRVYLPNDESLQRLVALEGEKGFQFWADARPTLSRNSLYAITTADVIVAPLMINDVEKAFEEAFLSYSFLVEDVEVLRKISFY